MSFGGTQPAAYTIPPLTTLRQDIDYLAAATVTHLCATIANPQTPQVDVTVRGNLVKAPVADAPLRTMPERATPRRRGPVVNRLASPSRPTTLKRNKRATNPRTSDHPSKDQARNGPVLAPQVRHKSAHDADAHRGRATRRYPYRGRRSVGAACSGSNRRRPRGPLKSPHRSTQNGSQMDVTIVEQPVGTAGSHMSAPGTRDARVRAQPG